MLLNVIERTDLTRVVQTNINLLRDIGNKSVYSLMMG